MSKIRKVNFLTSTIHTENLHGLRNHFIVIPVILIATLPLLTEDSGNLYLLKPYISFFLGRIQLPKGSMSY